MNNCCDSELNSSPISDPCGPTNDLTLSAMVIGNQGVLTNKLIFILLLLYAYTNQSFISYLMCTNDKLINNQLCLTDKLVDNLMDNLDDCRKGKHHRH